MGEGRGEGKGDRRSPLHRTVILAFFLAKSRGQGKLIQSLLDKLQPMAVGIAGEQALGEA